MSIVCRIDGRELLDVGFEGGGHGFTTVFKGVGTHFSLPPCVMQDVNVGIR